MPPPIVLTMIDVHERIVLGPPYWGAGRPTTAGSRCSHAHSVKDPATMLTARTDAVPSARSPLIVDSDARFSPTLPVVSVPAGEAAASRRARRREFDAIEGERQRLARELHDEAGY